MSLFPFVAPFVVVAAVLGLIWAFGTLLLISRDVTGGSPYVPVFVALAVAAVITAVAFFLGGRDDQHQEG
jgi:uncharacterized membrane protein